jgi:hypothetical protein
MTYQPPNDRARAYRAFHVDEILRYILVPGPMTRLRGSRASRRALHSDLCDHLARGPDDEVQHREAALARYALSIEHEDAFADIAQSREAEELAWISQQWADHFAALGI